MSDLWALLNRYMAAEGIRPQDLGGRTGVHPSQFQKIRDGRTKEVRPETLRKIAAGTGISLIDLIVCSGMFTAAELDARVVHRDPRHLSNDELIALVRERMQPEPLRGGSRATGETDDLTAFETDEIHQADEEETGRKRPRLLRGDGVSRG